MDKIVAFDIGGTFTKYALVDENGDISLKDRIKTPSNYETLLNEIDSVVTNINKGKNIICISSPCNYDNGALRGSSFAEYLVDKDIIGDLKMKFNLNVLIQNDGDCAALAEKWKGKNSSLSNFAVLVIGSGIGGGIIVNNALLKGENNVGGDIGYMLLASQPRINNVPSCLGILGAARYNYEIAEKIEHIDKLEDIFVSTITNPNMIKIREEMSMALAIGIINCTYILSPTKILIGGEISKNEYFINEINRQLDIALNLLPGYKYRPIVEATTFNNDSNLIGAASLYFNKIERY